MANGETSLSLDTEEVLSFDNILNDETEDLFLSREDQEKDKNKESTIEISTDDLFAGESESVDSSKESGKGDAVSKTGTSNSPNFYSSIATALKEDGILPDLDEEDLKSANTPEEFGALIEKQVNARLADAEKRIKEALDSGVAPTKVQEYHKVISYLDGLTEDTIKDETDDGENLRKQLIYQDFINRGFKPERAEREVNKSFETNNDIEDAINALESNKEFYKSEYEDILETQKAEKEKEKLELKKQSDALQKKVLETEEPFEGVKLDKNTRQQIFNNINKPIFKDKSGRVLTAIQKYQSENSQEFLYNVGLLYTLTDGFKKLDGLVKGKVTKEVKSHIKELESTLNTTRFSTDGGIEFLNNKADSQTSSGLRLDV